MSLLTEAVAKTKKGEHLIIKLFRATEKSKPDTTIRILKFSFLGNFIFALIVGGIIIIASLYSDLIPLTILSGILVGIQYGLIDAEIYFKQNYTNIQMLME